MVDLPLNYRSFPAHRLLPPKEKQTVVSDVLVDDAGITEEHKK